MQATAKIHLKVKSRQLLDINSIETIQGPYHWTVEISFYLKRILSYIYVQLPVKGLNLFSNIYQYYLWR